MILEKENAVLGNRELMGATNPKEAKEGTIRKKYGISIDKNSVHGSDSPLNAKIEIDFFLKISKILIIALDIIYVLVLSIFLLVILDYHFFLFLLFFVELFFLSLILNLHNELCNQKIFLYFYCSFMCI